MSTTIPARLNLALAALHVALSGYLFLALPLLLLPRSRWWLATLALAALAVNPLWALTHEAIHGVLHPSPRVNALVGRVLAVTGYGASFKAATTAHLLHHKHNEPTGYYDPRATPRWRAQLAHYAALLVDPYAAALATSALALLPARLLRAWFSQSRTAQALCSPRNLGEVRLDGALVLALTAASGLCYGRDAWAVAVIYAARCAAVSLLDSVYHHGAAPGDNLQGYHLRLPPLAQALLLNFNLHGVHHRHPRLPWVALPAAFAAQGGRHDAPFVRAVLAQFAPARPLPASRP